MKKILNLLLLACIVSGVSFKAMADDNGNDETVIMGDDETQAPVPADDSGDSSESSESTYGED